jgi:hypothetical protein
MPPAPAPVEPGQPATHVSFHFSAAVVAWLGARPWRTRSRRRHGKGVAGARTRQTARAKALDMLELPTR